MWIHFSGWWKDSNTDSDQVALNFVRIDEGREYIVDLMVVDAPRSHIEYESLCSIILHTKELVLNMAASQPKQSSDTSALLMKDFGDGVKRALQNQGGVTILPT